MTLDKRGCGKICIVGGGNVGTVLAGFVASRGYRVSVFTDRPDEWGVMVEVTDPDGKCFDGKLDCVSADPSVALSGVDMVLICASRACDSRQIDCHEAMVRC